MEHRVIEVKTFLILQELTGAIMTFAPRHYEFIKVLCANLEVQWEFIEAFMQTIMRFSLKPTQEEVTLLRKELNISVRFLKNKYKTGYRILKNIDKQHTEVPMIITAQYDNQYHTRLRDFNTKVLDMLKGLIPLMEKEGR